MSVTLKETLIYWDWNEKTTNCLSNLHLKHYSMSSVMVQHPINSKQRNLFRILIVLTSIAISSKSSLAASTIVRSQNTGHSLSSGWLALKRQVRK